MMYSRPWGFGVLCSLSFMFLFTACQSTTGKTADQTVSDGSITPGTVDPRIVDGSKVTIQYVFIAPAFTG